MGLLIAVVMMQSVPAPIIVDGVFNFTLNENATHYDLTWDGNIVLHPQSEGGTIEMHVKRWNAEIFEEVVSPSDIPGVGESSVSCGGKWKPAVGHNETLHWWMVIVRNKNNPNAYATEFGLFRPSEAPE